MIIVIMIIIIIIIMIIRLHLFGIKFKIVSFASSIMKNIVVIPDRSILPVKITCGIAFRPTPSAGCLLKSSAIIL